MSVEQEIDSIVSDSSYCCCYCCRCYFSSSTAKMNMMTMTNKKPTSRQKFSSSKRKNNTMNIINRTHSTTNSSYSTKWLQLILMGLCFLFFLELCSCIITTISSSSSSNNLDSSLDSSSRSSESSKLVDTDIDVSLPSYDTNTNHRHRNDNSHHRNHIHDHQQHQHHPHHHHHHQHQLMNGTTNERLASAQNYLGRIRADQKRKQVQMQKQKQKRFINFELNEKPQVPEQLPIVVSTSDNSYVSASPIIINPPQQQKATTLAPETTTLVVNNDEPDHHQMNDHQHHRPNLRSTNTISSQHHNSFKSPFHSRQPLSNHIRLDHQNEKNRKHRFWSSWHRNPLFWSPKEALQADNSIRSSIYLDNNNKISSSTSDISTTATTTQRNSQDIGLLGEVMKPTTSISTKPESLISRFEIKLATIINTQESIDAGATFINYTVVTNFDACLVECWITDSCDTAIYQESTTASMSSSSSSSKPSSSQSSYSYSERQHNYLHSKRRQHSNNIDINNNNNLISFDGSTFDSSNSIYHICFLFECIKSDGFRCQFSAHDNYVSSILMKKINSVRGDDENFHQTMHHSKRKSNGNDEEEEEEEAENYYTRISDKKRENSARKNAIIQVEDNDDDDDENEDEGEDAENEDKEKVSNFVSGRICNSVLEFKCSSLQCIGLDRRCDGIVDCIDGSDESDCPNFIAIDDADSNVIQTIGGQQGKKVFRSIPSVTGKGDYVSGSKDDAETSSSILPMAKTAKKHDFLNEYRLIDDQDQIGGNSFNLEPIIEPKSEVHYSRIIDRHHHHHHNGHTLNRLDLRGGGSWHHDTHIASIRIGEYEDYERGGLNSALIAIVFGIAITGMLIMIVGHKMRSIRKRLAYKNRRRSLVPDKELFISTLPI